MIKDVTRDSFGAEVERAASPVLVELWAPWCVYCRRLGPALERMSEKRGVELPIAKINIDEEPELAERLGADVIPTLYLYQNGAHGDKLVAPSSQAQLESWIDGQLG